MCSLFSSSEWVNGQCCFFSIGSFCFYVICSAQRNGFKKAQPQLLQVSQVQLESEKGRTANLYKSTIMLTFSNIFFFLAISFIYFFHFCFFYLFYIFAAYKGSNSCLVGENVLITGKTNQTAFNFLCNSKVLILFFRWHDLPILTFKNNWTKIQK